MLQAPSRSVGQQMAACIRLKQKTMPHIPSWACGEQIEWDSQRLVGLQKRSICFAHREMAFPVSNNIRFMRGTDVKIAIETALQRPRRAKNGTGTYLTP